MHRPSSGHGHSRTAGSDDGEEEEQRKERGPRLRKRNAELAAVNLSDSQRSEGQ
jgi:hypothetical protein